MSEFNPRSDEEAEQAITRLADGTLGDRERLAVEAWAAERPDVLRDVERHRRVHMALSADWPPVPDSLTVGLRRAPESRGRRAAPRRRLTWQPVAGALALGAAAVLAVVVFASSGSTPTGHDIVTAAALLDAPSSAPAPAQRTYKLLDTAYAGITFPNYAQHFGATPSGKRIDVINGRPVLTVFYRLPDGKRLSYSIFSGAPVSLPPGTKTVYVNGTALHVFTDSRGAQVVTLVRRGRTCVLAVPAGHSVEPYAAWPIQVNAA
jgi:hypothetical protein